MMISKEDCPKGDICGVHYRLTDYVVGGIVSLIDYVGEYAVFTQTTDNIAYAMSLVKGMPVDAVVQVIKVGDAAIADVIQSADDLEKAQVYRGEITVPFGIEVSDETFEEYFNKHIKDAHQSVMQLAESGEF